MRVPRQLRLMTLMVVVAVVAVSLGCAVLWRRAAAFRRLAAGHAVQEQVYKSQERSKASTAEAGRKQAEMWRRRAEATGSKSAAEAAESALAGIEMFEGQARELSAKAEYHALLLRKYLLAASRPWNSGPPDPRPNP
jgi:hypothetical protein